MASGAEGSAPEATGPASDASQPQKKQFEGSAALREDQIVNAVAFLLNPKVSSASTEAKTTFLVKKGLTAAEIDEAYRRAPPAPAVVTYTPQTAQPATPPQFASLSAPGQVLAQQSQLPLQQGQELLPQPYQVSLQQQQQHYQQQQVQQKERPSWSAIVLALTAVAAGGYGLQRLVAPYAREYYQRWQNRTAGDDTADAGQLTAAPTSDAASGARGSGMTTSERSNAGALADAIKCQTEELQSTVKQLTIVLEAFKKDAEQGRRAAPMEAEDSEDGTLQESLNTLRRELRAEVRADLQAELRSFAQTISELTGDVPGNSAAAVHGKEFDSQTTASKARNGFAQSESSRPSVGSYHMNGSNETKTTSGLPAVKTTSGGVEQNKGEDAPPATKSGRGLVTGGPLGESSSSSETPPMADVMAMMQAGITPPNVRTDIVDVPPDSAAPPSSSRLTPLAKPWEKAPARATAGDTPTWATHASVHVPRPSSAASSLSDTLGVLTGNNVAGSPWKPPPVPQPSLPLPVHRTASSAPSGEDTPSVASSRAGSVFQASKHSQANDGEDARPVQKGTRSEMPSSAQGAPEGMKDEESKQVDLEQQENEAESNPDENTKEEALLASHRTPEPDYYSSSSEPWEEEPTMSVVHSNPLRLKRKGDVNIGAALRSEAPEFKPKPSESIDSINAD